MFSYPLNLFLHKQSMLYKQTSIGEIASDGLLLTEAIQKQQSAKQRSVCLYVQADLTLNPP